MLCVCFALKFPNFPAAILNLAPMPRKLGPFLNLGAIVERTEFTRPQTRLKMAVNFTAKQTEKLTWLQTGFYPGLLPYSLGSPKSCPLLDQSLQIL